MSLMFEPLRKYATFRGRARRREYWLFQLFVFLLSLVLMVWLVSVLPPSAMDEGASMSLDEIMLVPAAQAPLAIAGLLGLVFFLPQLAVSVRRLHDSDKSGWWLLLNLIPAGSLVLLIFYLLDGTRGPNRHGPDPKGRTL
jgi:uncharacterized membrane protein YhaH (DUF805 family)